MLQQNIDSFLQAKYASGKLPSTLSFYRRVLGEFSQFSQWPPTPANIREYLGHKRETCKEITISSTFTGLRTFLNWCEGEKLLANNPLGRIEQPKCPRSLPKAVSVKTIRALLTTIAKNQHSDDLAIRDHALFRLAYDTGARASELARMLLIDLDLDENEILIRGGKGQKDRKVYFGKKCVSALQTYLDTHPGGITLFLNNHGNPLTRTGIYQILQKWCDLAGVRMTVHQIRHSYATHSIRRGIELDIIQRQMGHADISTTAIYLLVEDTERRQAYREKAPGDVI